MKPSFTEYQTEIEQELLRLYNIKTTLEMRNHISFCYHFTDDSTANVVTHFLLQSYAKAPV